MRDRDWKEMMGVKYLGWTEHDDWVNKGIKKKVWRMSNDHTSSDLEKLDVKECYSQKIK